VNIVVWIASGLLAAAYLFAGGAKLLTPKERLATNPSMAAAAEALSATSLKLIGGLEVAGALGLIHGRRAEYKQWPVNAVFLAVAVFIAAARTSEIVR
jgi:DoxX-like family